MDRRLLGAALCVATLVACRSHEREPRGGARSGVASDAPRAGRTDAAARDGTSDATDGGRNAASPSASAPAEAPLAVAADACLLVRGPVELPFTGPATLWLDERGTEAEPRILFNQGGIARQVTLPAAPAATTSRADAGTARDRRMPERLPSPEIATRATMPACATAGGLLFCMDETGTIRRSSAPDELGEVLARARPGSPVAAASIAGSHVVYAFLATRRTIGGPTLLAFAGVDAETPVRISEDGGGATFVTLARRRNGLVALYVDARRAFTPVHARELGLGPGLRLGPDAVLFVAEGSESLVAGAIAQGAPGSDHALLAMAKDEKEFGMAAIPIDQPPRDDSPVSWSLYPGATGRAPLAATQGALPVHVLRARPASAEPHATQLLELGTLAANGRFEPQCQVAEGSTFADLAIAVDRRGALWLAYTDASGSWLERRGK
jgi:hypothetical protein